MTVVSTSPDAADRSSYRRGVLLCVLAGAAWSTMGLGIRVIDVANVWQILFYRSLALSPFLFLVLSLRAKGWPFATIRAAGWPALFGAAGLVMAFAGGIFAIQHTTVANAMFLFAAAPFVAALFGWVLLRESVRRSTWAAMSVAMAGVAIMVVNGFAVGAAAGNIAALISAFGLAIFTVALRLGKYVDMLPTVFLAGILALGVAGTMCFAMDYGIRVPGWDILIAMAMGVGQIGIGLILFTAGSKSVPAAELALLSLTEVLLAPIWVWLVLGETASLYTLIGGGVLLVALVGNAISGMRRKPVPIV